MANEKVKVASDIKVNNGWFNFTDDKGRQIGIMEKDGKNPELKKIMDFAHEGTEFEANIVEKEGKFYAWDPKNQAAGGGFKKAFTPKDKSFEAAIAAAGAVAVLYANKSAEDLKNLPKAFETIHALILSKATEAPKA